MHGAPALDPTAPVFFMSYPRVNTAAISSDTGEMRPRVQQFFADVAVEVNELLPLQTGHNPGFLDNTMSGGEFWEPEILDALGRCQVFVPLLSPRFMASAWCRFEWESFSRRTVRDRNPGLVPPRSMRRGAIVPVSWTPIDPARLPPTVARVQIFTPSRVDEHIVKAYQAEGVYGLQQMSKHEEYRTVVWRLAQHIVETVYQHEVEPLVPQDASGVGRTFMEDH